MAEDFQHELSDLLADEKTFIEGTLTPSDKFTPVKIGSVSVIRGGEWKEMYVRLLADTLQFYADKAASQKDRVELEVDLTSVVVVAVEPPMSGKDCLFSLKAG
jgi:hypothetical protein